MDKYVKFVTGLGFSGVAKLKTRNSDVIKGFSYESFDPAITRSRLGKAKKHNPDVGKFVFLVSRDKAVRVDTQEQKVLLGDGKRVVSAFLESV